MIAALLLLARSFLERLDLPRPSTAAILEATQASRSRAYELTGALTALLPSLVQPVGRPKRPQPSPTPGPEGALEVTHRVLRYLLSHPGASTDTGGRRFYSEGFRRFVLDLRADADDLDLEAFADAVEVPIGTLDGWLRTRAPPEPDETPRADASSLEGTSLHIQTVIAAWRTWSGPFAAFVDHVNDNLRIPLGRSFIARVLFTYNERTPRRRSGRSVDEAAIRGAFEVFFPNAQWVGDGMQVPVVINGERFTFNLELDVDAYSGAFVGASIRDEEDSQAVIEAFEDGLRTVGAAPLAILLDNRSSNHTEDVDEALGDTQRMRSTPGRPQNKAHVEGAFGLFAQQAPPIDVEATSLRDLAKELLRLRVQTFFRSMNHRARRDRNWQSRVDLHGSEPPSEEAIVAARAALEEQRKKRELATAHDLCRADPVVRRFLDETFERLGIIDPEQYARAAIARYGRNIVVEAVAIFEGKNNTGTLPDNVDAARYILGIAKNIGHVHEADEVTQALMRNRVAMRDSLLTSLEADLGAVLRERDRSPRQTLAALIDHALDAHRTIDQLFWIDAAGDLLSRQPPDQQKALFRHLARRIHTTFVLRPHERATMERRLARIVWPVN